MSVPEKINKKEINGFGWIVIFSKSRTAVQRFLNPKKMVLFIIEIILLLTHFFAPQSLLIGRLILGIASYILIPGFLILSNLNTIRLLPFEEIFGFSLLFGFSMQTLIVTIFWGFHIETSYLGMIITIFTIVIVFIMLLKHSGNFQFKFRKDHLFSTFFLILIFAVIVRSCYFFVNVSSVGIDGGLYCDFARTIVSEGRFSSNIINDGWVDPFFNVKGFTSSPLTVFSIATFFFIGDISYTSAKLSVFFIGILVVFLIYKISNELFSKEVAMIAGLISAVFPLLSYYSSILHGPEILSTLFVLASTYFFIFGVKGNSCKLYYMSLSGLFCVMAHGAWGMQAFVPHLVALTFVFFLFKIENKKLCVYALSLMIGLFFAYRLSAILFIQLPLTIVPFISLSILILYKKTKNSSYIGITIFVVTAILLLQLFFMRSYLAPEMYIIPSTKVFMENPIEVVNPFSLTPRISAGVDYVLNTFSRFWHSIALVLTPLLFGISVAAFFNPIKFKQKMVILIFPLIVSIMFVVSLPEYVVWSGITLPDRFLISSVCFLIILSAVTINTLLTTYKRFGHVDSIVGKDY